MGLPKGVSGNPKGRPKGSKNKATKMTREVINGILIDNLPEYIKKMKTLEAKDFCQSYERLLKFQVPQQTQTKIDLNNLSAEDLDKLIDQLSE